MSQANSSCINVNTKIFMSDNYNSHNALFTHFMHDAILFYCFTFSRFLLIGYPLKAKQILTKWNVRISILVIWIVAIVTTLPLPIRFTFVAVAHFKEV